MESKEAYICTHCDGMFVKVRSDEDALAEARERYGWDVAAANMAIVCNDCYDRYYARGDSDASG